MSGLFTLYNSGSLSFNADPIPAGTINAAGGAVVSNIIRQTNLRKIRVTVSYTTPASPVDIMVSLYNASTPTGTLAGARAAAQLTIPATNFTNRSAIFTFISDSENRIGEADPFYIPERTLYNDAAIAAISDPDGNTFAINNSFRPSCVTVSELPNVFRVLVQNVDASTSLTFAGISIALFK